ncbi:TPR and ankyrin repeat-containing protein 1 [Hippopotamus amphibius kiboko]|uniref:TPR and ankyrin repeat-containing protein 1 n=1 Tax=Hippopotamus amphibius kiboko TaxID=575201 RepID=UPI00259486AE|nr:TPR and ankyrin repeat-containing protein 1 [Hippopotamus amphibius kiboko]XP_057562025.1 TPR and ankyrin repeat-containing protein 1 [Hippopotamus amphibius kiboko]XP_057562026.1 TPR and ankyrin repeat-containing protein 1 [Hippopotamus amphibius kiboko]
MDPIAYAELLKESGNQVFKNGNFSLAIRKYDEAIQILLQLYQWGAPPRDLAVLLCNKSYAFYNLGKWNEASVAAKECLQWDPTYVKGYYRAGYSLLCLHQPYEAAHMFFEGLHLVRGSQDRTQVADFLVGVFTTMGSDPIVLQSFLPCFDHVFTTGFSTEVWQSVIEKLAKKGLWHSFLLLSARKDRLPRNLHVPDLSLKSLFEKYVFIGLYENMEQVPRLVQWLISMGASIETIGPYPLHALVRLCIQAGENHLFRWLMDYKPEWKGRINQKDEDGRTVLHLVAAHSPGYLAKRQTDDVQMLLRFGADPTLLDRQSRSAVDVLKRNKNFRAIEKINSHLEKLTASSKDLSGLSNGEGLASEGDNFRKASEQLVTYMNSGSCLLQKNFLKQEVVQRFLRLLSSVQEIPPDLVYDIDRDCANAFIKFLLEKQKWPEVLLLLTRKVSGEPPLGDGLIKDCDLSNLDLCAILPHLRAWGERRALLLSCLIDHGASPEGLQGSQERPLAVCLKHKDFELAFLLLTKGADPRSISLTEGDTPLHAALHIFLDVKADIGFDFLSHLLDLFWSKPAEFHYLNPNIQDSSGNTVMHILFQKGMLKRVGKLIGLLVKFDINLNLKNKEGKDARHRVKKNDALLLAWNKALGESKRRGRQDAGAHPGKTPRPTASAHSAHAAQLKGPSKPLHSGSAVRAPPRGAGVPESWETLPDAQATKPEPGAASSQRDRLVQDIAASIQRVELDPPLLEGCPQDPEPLETGAGAIGQKDEPQGAPGTGGSGCSGNNPAALEAAEGHVQAGLGAPQRVPAGRRGTEDSDDQNVPEMEAGPLDFENMTWEIECTSEILKKLSSKVMTKVMKKKIILAIQKLGNGEWTHGLRKRLKNLKGSIQLFEAKLDKGARMLWELAIDFSPRCSENPEKIMAAERSTHPTEKAGRVYTEIIRIWDIVLDHGKLTDSIRAICSAYNRGLSCILRKKLKGINKGQVSANLKIQKRIPRCYVEDTEADRGGEHEDPEYFPPASAVETEYNIMKFHSFSTSMASNILNDTTATVEYPFRVGELEYAVIDLNPRPLEPIILIGRSGTGKTTCCLYRLWKKFHGYWEKAERAGSPLLAKQIWLKRRLELEPRTEGPRQEEEEDEEEDEEEEEEGPMDEEAVDSPDEEQEREACAGGASGEPGGPQQGAEGPAPEQPHSLEHLHQIFVTKNHVLCQEVQRNFVELSKSTKATSHYKPLDPSVHKLQDLRDENFPLFVTSKQLLLLLDASLPKPFFLRNEDGSLKRAIAGWSTQEELTITNWQEEEEEAEVDGDYGEEEKAVDTRLCDSDPRVYVTFEVFVNEIWPKMIKGKTSYNPALIWKEIKSFLKGSFEALSSPQGRLTEEAYKQLGRKRSPNFKEDRSEIYGLFCLYQRIRSQKGYFDEEDVLYNLSRRLSKIKVLPWSIHELYGDEIQDFTQAELALLMKCINDPNAMFLTGDTAQSIMKGVAFRFSDLRSLFHYASRNAVDKQCAVRKPKRIHQLYQNYRSHSGILNLASGVVDLLQFYFPESFDRLPRDSGLFDGPKPIVLESCSVSDLAILLRGNKRKTQPIEFGAHQVILVAHEMAKEKIPEELGLALVLTVYEAKGLEFDDVLLYNFFTDSEAYKEWKIISSFTASSSESREESLPLMEVPLETCSSSQGRAFPVNPEMYKLLNGELKQLYTAITRARVNLWIFDENPEKRAPAFKYFMKRNFVQVVKMDENKDLDDSMFVKTSTPAEWIAQGDYYAKHQCWKVAAKCYQKGGAIEKEKLALAHNTALNMKSKKVSPKEKQVEYLELAKTYLDCKEPKLSLKCLSYAKEFQLCAQLCERLGKIRDAAYFYKRSQCYQDAFRCFEQIQEFDLALKMYCQEELFEEAAVAVEKYEEMLRAKTLPISQLSYSASQFYLEAAAKYLSANKMKEMMAVLSKLDTEDQLVFLKSRKRLTEAADLLNREGRREEAALLMKQHGRLLEAARLTADKAFQASCLLAAARLNVARDSDVDHTEAILREALDLCHETRQASGIAEAHFLQGVIQRDFGKLKDAFRRFNSLSHSAGAVEALYEATSLCEARPEEVLALAPWGLEVLLNLVRALQKVNNNAEKEMVKSCFEFFGISQVDAAYCQIAQSDPGPILRIIFDLDLNLREKKTKEHFLITTDQVKLALNKHLLRRLCQITRSLLGKTYPGICTRFIVGLKCEDGRCEDFHRPLRRHEAKCLVQSKIHLVVINGLLLEAKKVFPKVLAEDLEEINDILSPDKYGLCKSLLNVLFPKHFHQRVLSENPVACKEVLKPRNTSSRFLRSALKEYICVLFQNERPRSRRESTDLWLSAMQAFLLSSSYPDELDKLLHQEEDSYNRELKALQAEKEERGRGRGSRVKGVEGKFGMLAPNKDDASAEKTHLCFIRLLEDSIHQFYVCRNPEDYKRRFFRFMNVLVKRCKEPLIPSIGNTVALLEFQFVHCGAVLVRLCKNAVLCLPKSYIALLHYWEFLFSKKDRELRDVFTIIQEYRPKEVTRAIQNFRFHLSYLVKVLCGCENENFNVLLDAFGEIDYVVSGEAERTLVLCLVMLVNTEGVLQPSCKPLLSGHFQEIEAKLQVLSTDCPGQVPERLLRVVKRVRLAVNVKSVAEALQDLLFERDEEYLMDCHWQWDSGHTKGTTVRGLYHEEVRLNRLFSVDPTGYFVEPEGEIGQDETEELASEDRDHLLAAILSQKQRKASIQQKLRRVCLVVSLCISWRRRVGTQAEHFREEGREPGAGSFKKADVDRTQCDLCGVKFTHGPENYFSPNQAFEAEAPEAVALSGAELEDEQGRERSIESYEQHIHLESHQRQQVAYQKYSDFFHEKVDPAIVEGKLVVQDMEQSVWVRSDLGSKEHSDVLQRKVQENIKKVSDTVEDLYRRKAWADAEEVMARLVSSLIPSVRDAQEWLRRRELHLKEEGVVQEDDYENEVEDFGELRPRRRPRKYAKKRKY